jgi:hypothetical protein
MSQLNYVLRYVTGLRDGVWACPWWRRLAAWSTISLEYVWVLYRAWLIENANLERGRACILVEYCASAGGVVCWHRDWVARAGKCAHGNTQSGSRCCAPGAVMILVGVCMGEKGQSVSPTLSQALGNHCCTETAAEPLL